MSQNENTVRFTGGLTPQNMQRFALAISQALVKLSGSIKDSRVVPVESVNGKTGSWAIALYDEVTGVIGFLPGVRFVPVGGDDTNIGFELDVSPRVGSGIGGTSQGYMFNFGTVGGSKLAAGMSANNEDTNIPRVDAGFKPKRGARMEFYGTDGDIDNDRKGQFRAIIGPDGKLMVVRYVSGDSWEVIGGFDSGGEVLCGYKYWEWPASVPGVLNVYNQTDGNNPPVAKVENDGKVTASGVSLYDGGNTEGSDKITIDPTGVSGEVTFTLQQKTFVGDANPSWVLCAATV